LRRYTVGLQPYERDKARGVLEEVRKESGVFVAVAQAYSGETGLKFEFSPEDIIV